GAGGKTLELADLMERTGTVVACDVRSYKLDDLRIRARRAGFPNIVTREWDGKPFKGKQAGGYDGVLVDAPCSCSGVWRRNPDGRWTLKPEDVEEAAALQQRILEAASTAVRSGGLLIYATCSLFPRENGGVVDAFLASHEEFALEPFEHPLTGEPCGGMLQVRSFDGDCDSMFVARLRRKEAES
ncbi:MAG TPA: SAM-dependent methyltransferase, partial [Lentisphaeria bacterium]|nr:SAM-dependent methyltransferase [Lentisphaeria bacterium]